MTKRCFFISLLLCVVSLSVAAQEPVVEYIEGSTTMCQGDLRDIVYAEPTQGGPLRARQYAGSSNAPFNYRERITNMPQYLHDFMTEFVRAGQEVLNGGSNWLSDPTMATRGSSSYYYPLKQVTGTAPFTFPRGASTDVIKQAANDVVLNVVNQEDDVLKSFLPYAFFSLNYDHPEFFWIGNGYNFGANHKSQLSYNPSLGAGTVTYTIDLMFHLLSMTFDIRTNGVGTYNFRKTANLANGVQKFNASKEAILAQCTGSRYDKLLTAHDWLTHHNCYNYYYLQGYGQNKIGDTPWSAYSAMEGNDGQQSPVCEGYARAFKVLCDDMDIPCILMSGVVTDGEGNRGGHMWNYVQMEDEKWYVVDVTWDDPTVMAYYNQAVTGCESQDWFLLGSESPVDGGMTLIESHPEEWFNSYPSKGSYSWNLLSGPQLSPTAYTPGGFMAGDVNGDNGVDIADAVAVMNAMAGGTVSGNPDVNGDGSVDIADAVKVLNIMAGH